MTLRKVCIVMNISTISYWFYEAFESMKKNLKNVFISVSSMIATMIIVAARIFACGKRKLCNRPNARNKFKSNGVLRSRCY